MFIHSSSGTRSSSDVVSFVTEWTASLQQIHVPHIVDDTRDALHPCLLRGHLQRETHQVGEADISALEFRRVDRNRQRQIHSANLMLQFVADLGSRSL